MNRYRTKEGVEVEDVGRCREISLGGKWLSMSNEVFDEIFEPIPESEDKPADSVTVRREAVAQIVGYLEFTTKSSLIYDAVEELRASLGDKACEHKTYGYLTDPESRIVGFKCECGATRTLGEWRKPETTQ